MKHPELEIRNSNETQSPRFEVGFRTSRSVLECGGPPPLSATGGRPSRLQSARGLAHSKTWRTMVASCLLAIALNHSALAQYAIDWSTIDGGGGTSTGGVYTVSGTIGQPDAGAMSGGNYTLQGGFWGVVAAVQTPGAPFLSVTRSHAAVVVSWPAPAPGWTLELAAALASGTNAWTLLPPPYVTNGANLQFTEPAPVGNRFYRLHKP